MESEAAEVSPSPSRAVNTGNRLKNVLSKARRDRNNNASKISVTGADNSSEGTGTGVRSSIESMMDKSRQSSLDDGNSRDRLAKLIPGHTKRKKKREEAAEVAEQAEWEDEEARGRRTSEQPATAAAFGPAAVTRSRSSLGDEASSLITVDSDAESPLGSPPPIISRQSHIGYLTASSPLIKTSNTTESPNIDSQLVGETVPSLRKSDTLPTYNNLPSASDLAPRHAATLGVEQGERSPKRSPSRDSRGVSPGTRIKDVFSTGSRKKDASPPESPDRESMTSNGGASGLGKMFKKEKRNSMSFRKGSKPSDIDSTASYSQQSLRSPNQSIQSLPNIVTTSPKSIASSVSEAPILTTTPPTPTNGRPNGHTSPTKGSISAGTNANTVTSASGNMISHRRIRSDSATHPPSKLSNAMSAPLTPTVEETRTPGGRTPATSGGPGGAGGFFSSVFSAAQNAASTFTNTIANNPPRPRSSPQMAEDGGGETLPASATTTDTESLTADEKRPLAIETLGSGDLSLSHLGIASDTPATSTSTTFPSIDANSVQRDEAAAKVEDASAARAVSAAYSEKVDDPNSTPVAEDNAPSLSRRSFTEKTTPNGSVFEQEPGSAFKRSGSVRSKVGAVTRRKRNSSAATAATGATIAAAIGAGHGALVNPAASASTQKLSGFTVANKKRNRDFHQLFRSVPEDDYLIEDYSCALQRDIILAGRIYISEGHICFYSNIVGWVTSLIISFDEVVSVEKENTAMVFPNAIAIQTLHARNTIRSLLSREATYDLLIGIWKLIHPNLKSTLNGARLDAGGTGDKTEKVDPSGSDDGSEVSEEEEELYDEDEEDDEGSGSLIDAADGEAPVSEAGDPAQKAATRKASAMGVGIGLAAGAVPTQSESKAGEKAAVAATIASVDFPGPATHPPTECGDADTHYDKILKDDVIPAPLGKVYSMTFGPASGGFMSKWLLDEMKVTDLQIEDDKRGLSEDNKSRSYSYIKPLYASIGPKQTKCLVTENLDSMDLEKAVSVTSSTQTPDVPSGNVFVVKTKCCLMWASSNSTRILMSCTIEWSGKSWLKGPIEKGANDGQSTHANDLVKALKAGVSSRPRAGTVNSKSKTKGKRSKGSTDIAKKGHGGKAIDSQAQAQADSWGMLEPLHPILGPVTDIFKPFISANMVIAFLLLFIFTSWLRGPRIPANGQLGYPGLSSPERIAAYDEIWRKEESDLWDWLEERIAMEGIAYPASSKPRDQEAVKKARMQREKSLKGQGMQARLAVDSMKEREVNYAIRVTEERLQELKGAMQRKRESDPGRVSPTSADGKSEPTKDGKSRPEVQQELL